MPATVHADDLVDRADILALWIRELGRVDGDPDPGIVASCEALAADQGWDPVEVLIARAFGNFDSTLHPRGHDGKFIEVGALMKLVDFHAKDRNGKDVDLSNRRAKVESITHDDKHPGQPDVRVRLLDKDGKQGPAVTVKPNNLVEAKDKGRLGKLFGKNDGPLPDIPDSPKPKQRSNVDVQDPRGPAPTKWSSQDELARSLKSDPYAGRSFADGGASPNLEEMRQRVHPKGEGGSPPAPSNAWIPAKPTSDPRHRQSTSNQRDQGTDWLYGGDILEPGFGGRARGDFRPAPSPARPTGLPPMRTVAQQRQDLINDINAHAAALSTDDAEARATELDKLLGPLRFSKIDTDQTYKIGGRWTPERAAQHEEMYDELLANVQRAGIPRDHDALALGGLPGSGKSSSLRPGGPAASLGVVSWEPDQPVPDGATHVSINPDVIKEMMIDRGMLPEGLSTDLKPREQVTFIHGESAYLSNLFSQRLADDGYNMVLDRTMESESAATRSMVPLAENGYRFRGLFADIPIDESKASVRKRYLDQALTPRGGRFVASSVMGNRRSTTGRSLSKNRDAFDALVARDWFTSAQVIDNTGITRGQPQGQVVAKATGTGSAATRYTQPLPPPTLPQSALPLAEAPIG